MTALPLLPFPLPSFVFALQAGIILRSAGRLDDNVEILTKMLNSEVLRENVITERHVYSLLADLLRAGKLREARNVFWVSFLVALQKIAIFFL